MLHRTVMAIAAVGATVCLFFSVYEQGWRDGYTLGRCETKCGQPPRSAGRLPHYPSILVCTCPNGDEFRLAE
jgi:hypothetical protein